MVHRDRRPPVRWLTGALFAAGLALAGSCNNPYDLLVHDRFEQAGFNGDVDILWVIDDSNSMSVIQDEIKANFGSFISAFANVDSTGGDNLAYDNVTDATIAFSEFLMNQDRFLNYQMGVTTTDLESAGNGNQGNLRSPGPIGQGDTCEQPAVLTPCDGTDASCDVADAFRTLADVGIQGAGEEYGLLAAAMSICKGMPSSFWDELDANPPDAADPEADPVKLVCSQVPVAERTCNQGFFRDGASTVVVIVSDEGDMSYQSPGFPPDQWTSDCVVEHAAEPTFGECDCRLDWYLDFFEAVGRPVVFATVGPTYQKSDDAVAWCDGTEVSFDGPCNPFTAPLCAVDFYQQAACLSGGVYHPIQVTTTDNDSSTCELANFQDALGNIGALISNLSAGWTLSMTPDPDTITVLVNGEEVPRGNGTASGWRYVPADRAIAFSPDTRPGFNAAVDIYYYPQHDRYSQVGRDLPF